MPLLYKCCVCKHAMSHEADPERPFDPCALVLVTNVNTVRSGQREQEFPCHFECFRRLVADDSLMYIMEPNYSSIGEMEDEQAGPNGEGTEWFEVWAHVGSLTYLMVVRPAPSRGGQIVVLDPKEDDRIVFEGENYEAVKLWLLEEEFSMVRGRVIPDNP
jgi:hypothetical protein